MSMYLDLSAVKRFIQPLIVHDIFHHKNYLILELFFTSKLWTRHPNSSHFDRFSSLVPHSLIFALLFRLQGGSINNSSSSCLVSRKKLAMFPRCRFVSLRRKLNRLRDATDKNPEQNFYSVHWDRSDLSFRKMTFEFIFINWEHKSFLYLCNVVKV